MSESAQSELDNDVEAQDSLLERGTGDQAETATTSFNAIEAFRKAFLFVLSTELFKSGVNYNSGDDTTSLSSASAVTADDNLYVETRDESDVDVEAQHESPLLECPARSANAGEAETPTFDARKAFQRVGLFIRSALVFKLDLSSSFSGSASYTAITTNPEDEEELISEESSAASSQVRDDSTRDTSNAHSTSARHEPDITVQEERRKHVTHEIVRKKNLQLLQEYGGVKEVAAVLNSDLEKGLSGPQEIFQLNSIQPCLGPIDIFHSFLAAWNNYAILLLCVAAALTLGFGIEEDGWLYGLLNGAVLPFIIFLIVILTTVKNCWEKWSNKRLENSWRSRGRNMQVQVVKQEGIRGVSESDLKVGDIAVLRKGDYVPADGLIVPGSGQELEIDEGLSKATTINGENPFLFYGYRVINGADARMLVISTRMDTVWGERMNQAMRHSAGNETKFVSWLHKLNTYVCNFGILQSIIIIIAMFLRHEFRKLNGESGYRPDSRGSPTKVKPVTDLIKGILTESSGTARVLATSLSLSLLGITEGMTFVTSVSTIIWSSIVLAHKASQREYLACFKMASVTTICIGQIGGVAEDAAAIGKIYVGEGCISESSVLASKVREGLGEGIASLSLQELHNDCQSKLVPLTSWAGTRLGVTKESMIEQCRTRSTSGQNPFQECCKIVVEKNGHEGSYIHCRGPLHNLLPLCTHHYGINGEILQIDDRKKRKLEQANGCMTAQDAEVVAFALGTFDETSAEPSNLIFVGMISIKEAMMEDSKRAISTLTRAGIRTILASGNDAEELKTIGEKCGILGPNDRVHRAEEFRSLSDEEKMNMVDEIRIMGNCQPSDKVDLIKCWRKKDHVVAFMVQSTMDAPALKQAHIGLTNGTWSSQMARESCDIIIWEDNCFSFLVDVIEKGRCYQDNIRKLIQLQLIFTASSLLINVAAVVFSGDAPITAGQLLWMNLVVPLLGGLALLTGPSTKEQMTMQISTSSKKLMTMAMWRNIAIQVSYQTAVFLVLPHIGHAVLGVSRSQLKSTIYNGFFMCQVLSNFIAREPEEMNIFRGLFHKNKWFWVGVLLLFVCQAVYEGIDHVLGSSPEWSWKLWSVCLFVGLGSWLMDLVGKTVSYSHLAARLLMNLEYGT